MNLDRRSIGNPTDASLISCTEPSYESDSDFVGRFRRSET